MKRREDLSLIDKLYIGGVLVGLGVSLSHLIKNFVAVVAKFLGRRKGRVIATYQYPDEQRKYSRNYRGRHRLTLNNDGSLKCTACSLCATACPAKCIYIEAAEHEDITIEKFPHRYEIDTLVCVYCGFCVDACPVDAIRMDTEIHPLIYDISPYSFVEGKDVLISRSKQIAVDGRGKILDEHISMIRLTEKTP